jgi:putative drug exporter of the RND superfamily
VATGVGAVMIAAIVPFATTDLLNVKQFGIGIAVAVLLDILIVRPLLLPATVGLFGRAIWWPTRAGAPPGRRRGPRVPRPRVPRRTRVSA